MVDFTIAHQMTPRIGLNHEFKLDHPVPRLANVSFNTKVVCKINVPQKRPQSL